MIEIWIVVWLASNTGYPHSPVCNAYDAICKLEKAEFKDEKEAIKVYGEHAPFALIWKESRQSPKEESPTGKP